MELTGFEPVTPSLRKMRSNRFDQGTWPSTPGLWPGCGASHVRQREILPSHFRVLELLEGHGYSIALRAKEPGSRPAKTQASPAASRGRPITMNET